MGIQKLYQSHLCSEIKKEKKKRKKWQEEKEEEEEEEAREGEIHTLFLHSQFSVKFTLKNSSLASQLNGEKEGVQHN